MMNAGKLFILLGIIFVVIGLIWTFIGRLPGDISFKKGNFSFHFPIMTSIVVSIILTLVFYILGKFR
ncbi:MULTISPECIES: DUF2905 domain-containing protein [Virgibacillus]|uniref:DUF2905 domain-containing protein n=2 Tax=Virgibacillus TaxID=84406 RepID=A0A1H1B4C9_9BACI|nr:MULTISPECIES: DUF2905 domain-containing protein [Virgibacillus]MBP1947655.1 hypothetical protein [Virgibacillus litoralis]SDQ46760.1 Protein of unknown function [Virgibacillus salinus]